MAKNIAAGLWAGDKVQLVRDVVDINKLDKATLREGTVATIVERVWLDTYSILPDGDKERDWRINFGRLPTVHGKDVRSLDMNRKVAAQKLLMLAKNLIGRMSYFENAEHDRLWQLKVRTPKEERRFQQLHRKWADEEDEDSVDRSVMAKSVMGDTTDVRKLVEFTEKEFRRVSRFYNMSRVYAQIGTGGSGVHADIAYTTTGNYSVWFEGVRNKRDELVGFASEVTASGEGIKQIEDVWWKELDGKEFNTIGEWQRILKDFFAALGDAQSELARDEEDEE